jgi:hypothetical protein
VPVLVGRLDALGDREQSQSAGQVDDAPGHHVGVGVPAQTVDELAGHHRTRASAPIRCPVRRSTSGW